MDNNLYKLYQLFNFFNAKFSYQLVNFGERQTKKELWIANPSSNAYQLIRLTVSSLETVEFEKTRIDQNIASFSRAAKNEKINFLDMHLTREEVYEEEVYDTVSLDSDYYDGLDISSAYPGIKHVVHDVKDPNAELQGIINEINRNNTEKIRQQKALRRKPNAVTITLIAISVIVYGLQYFLGLKYPQTAVDIILGADYRFFTQSLHQYWRLASVMFTHGSWIHLLMNMSALYLFGSYYEEKLGKAKYLLVLISSTAIASLAHWMFNGNGLLVGMSGGLYAFLAMRTADVLIYRHATPSFYQMLGLNLLINFMPGVGYLAHLGGFITGLCYYFIFIDKRFSKAVTVLLICFALFLGFNFTRNDPKPIYGGTDLQVLETLEDLGLKSYSKSLEKRIYEAYGRIDYD